MPFCCECRGPCRRSVDITPLEYSRLRKMGAVITPECAEREDREIVHRYNDTAVVALTNGPRQTRRFPHFSQEGAI